MEYQTTKTVVQAEPPMLMLTKQEAKCTESLVDFAVGDQVIVVYMGTVCPVSVAGNQSSLGVLLDRPIIVERPAFALFAERFMDFLSDSKDQPSVQASPVLPTPSVL